MSVFMVIESRVKDTEKYDQYISKVSTIVAQHRGRYLVRGGKVTTIGGQWDPERMIIIEFPSETDVTQWLSSAAYQAIADLRIAGADTRAVLLEGIQA
jgi:uncharacterized protein (DUF1330 family)